MLKRPSPRGRNPEAQAGGRLGASFLFPKGSGKNLCPSPKQAPLTRKLRPASLARDQETLQAVRRCLPKRGACRQEWEVWGGGSGPAQTRARFTLSGAAVSPRAQRWASPGAGGRGRDWLRAQAQGPLFPSQGLQASRTKIQTSASALERGPQPEETRSDPLDRSFEGTVSSTLSGSQNTRRRAVG